MAGLSDGVLSQLPDQPALAQTVRGTRRPRRQQLPSAPTRLALLRELPDRYKDLEENFLILTIAVKRVKAVKRMETVKANRTTVMKNPRVDVGCWCLLHKETSSSCAKAAHGFWTGRLRCPPIYLSKYSPFWACDRERGDQMM